ncbi:MAG: hypothetical protein ACRC33_23575, partial [Gemmataceae bacterium]
ELRGCSMGRKWSLVVLVLVGHLAGCGANRSEDSAPPPGVRKNESRNTAGPKKGKATLLGKKPSG